MKMNTENYKNKGRKVKKMCREKKKRAQDCKVHKGMEEANKRNEARKVYIIARGLKASFQPRMSVCKDGEDN